MRRCAVVLLLAALLLAVLLGQTGCGRRDKDAARSQAAPAADALSGASIDPAVVRAVEAAQAETPAGPLDQDLLDLLSFQRALHDIAIIEDDVMLALYRAQRDGVTGQPLDGDFAAAFRRAGGDLLARPLSADRQALRAQFAQALDSMAVAYDLLERKGPEDAEVSARFQAHGPAIQECFRGLAASFSMERLLGVDVAKLQELKAQAEQVASPEFQAAGEKLAAGDTVAAYDAFAALGDRNPGTELELRCRLRQADLLLRDPTSARWRAAGRTLELDGLSQLRRVVDAQVYMPALYEGWRKWRVASEFVRSDTSLTAVPNRAYDLKRYQVLTTIRHHLREHPEDLWARFQYVALAQQDILRKVGPDPRMNPLGQEWLLLYPQ